jgi:hypothetical protein
MEHIVLFAVVVRTEMACAFFNPEGRVIDAFDPVFSMIIVIIDDLGDASLLCIRAFGSEIELPSRHFAGC